MSNVENTQPTDGQPTENATAAEQAAEAPSVPTAGAENASSEAPAQTDQQTETVTAEQATTTEAQPDPSQLAADGDAVVGGLEENRTEQAPPNEGQ